jgi:hypothetical protein
MKSKDFGVNEAFLGIDPWKMAGNYALKQLGKYTNPDGLEDPNQQRNFIKLFTQQYNKEYKIHPNLNIDDFMDMYWRKNNWDASNLPTSYQQSLDNAKQTVTTNPSPQTIQQLAGVVYNIALMLPKGGYSYRQQQTQPVTATAAAASSAPQIDPNTTQITSKIRSMSNTPQEIDDLLYIAGITLMKIKMIAPKQYKDVIASLFNNGGNPSVSAATNSVQQSTRQRKSPAEKPMMAAGGRLNPDDPNDANLLKAIQNAQAQGK